VVADNNCYTYHPFFLLKIWYRSYQIYVKIMVNNLQTFAKKFTKNFLSSLCGMAGIKNL
jgi:hypothetical protein